MNKISFENLLNLHQIDIYITLSNFENHHRTKKSQYLCIIDWIWILIIWKSVTAVFCYFMNEIEIWKASFNRYSQLKRTNRNETNSIRYPDKQKEQQIFSNFIHIHEILLHEIWKTIFPIAFEQVNIETREKEVKSGSSIVWPNDQFLQREDGRTNNVANWRPKALQTKMPYVLQRMGGSYSEITIL